MATSDTHLVNPYVDIAHRAALLYSFTTTLLAVFVELSARATWLNLTAATGFVAGQSFRPRTPRPGRPQ